MEPNTSLAAKMPKIVLNLIPQNRKTLALKYLKDISVPPIVAYEVAKKMLGDIRDWECETVEISLKKELGDIPGETLQKIFACMTLDAHENIILDTSSAFKNYAVVFNNQSPIADIDELIHVREAAWAVVALNSFDVGKRIYLDYEPVVYLARLLHGEGFLVAPPGIAFVQENLNSLNKNTELVSKIKKTIDSGGDLGDELVATQVSKVESVKDYISFKFQEQMSRLTEFHKEADKL